MHNLEWIDRVAQHGVALDARQIEQLTQYSRLLREWNLERVTDEFVDSLSLVDVLRANVAPGAAIMDVSSEIGVPAILLAVALPDRRFVFTERNTEKAAFLWKVMGALELDHVSLIHGDTGDGAPWPQGALHDSVSGEIPEDSPVLITVRAKEPLESVMDIVDILPEGGLFLCHSGELVWKLDEKMFHVEHFEDAWTRSGDRRGRLHLVRFQG